MDYCNDLGRFLALCLKAGRRFDEAYDIAFNDFGIKLGSPEALDYWGRTYHDKIWKEYAVIPNMSSELLADLMANDLKYLGDELEFILPSEEELKKANGSIDAHEGRTDAAPDNVAPVATANNGDRTLDSRLPRELIEVQKMVHQIEDILLGMLKDRGIDIDRIAA